MRVSPTTWRDALRSASRGGRCRGRDLVDREVLRPDHTSPDLAISTSEPRAGAFGDQPPPGQERRRPQLPQRVPSPASSDVAPAAGRQRPSRAVAAARTRRRPTRHRVGGTASTREGAVAHGYSEQQHRQTDEHDDARGHAAGDPVGQEPAKSPCPFTHGSSEPVLHRGLLPRCTASGVAPTRLRRMRSLNNSAAAGDEHRAARHCGHPSRGPYMSVERVSLVGAGHARSAVRRGHVGRPPR
jgi:hypothetical protein